MIYRHLACFGALALTAMLIAAVGCSDDAEVAATAPVGGSAVAAGGDDAPKPEPEWLVCSADADCTSMPERCCGCEAGGKAIAIAKAYFDDYEGLTAFDCGAEVCPSVMSTDSSCSKKAACVGGKCTLVAGDAAGATGTTGGDDTKTAAAAVDTPAADPVKPVTGAKSGRAAEDSKKAAGAEMPTPDIGATSAPRPAP